MDQGQNSFNTLSDLQTAMKKCRLCQEEGYEIYPPAVFSGVSPAQLMTVGQAPGITEQEAQRDCLAGWPGLVLKRIGFELPNI